MCSELFRIPIQLGPVPLFGFGVLLALWLLASAAILWQTVRVQGWSSDAWGFLPVILMVSAALVFLPRLFPGGLPIRGYGVMLLFAAGAGVWISSLRAEQMGVSRDVIISLAFRLFVCGILGARLFYVIEYWETDFQHLAPAAQLAKALNFPEGGLVIYGGLMGGMAAFVWFVYSHKLPLFALADIAAPGFMIGLAIGRIGCLLNGCCYGGPCEQPWAVTFPKTSPPYADQVAHGQMHGMRLAVDTQGQATVAEITADSQAAEAGLAVGDKISTINGERGGGEDHSLGLLRYFLESGKSVRFGLTDGRELVLPGVDLPPRSKPIHPTQIYSTINAALITWLLWSFHPYRRRDGEVALLMLTVYPVSRFLLEIIRTDESAIFGTGLSISQNISIAILCGVLAAWLALRWQPVRMAS